MREEREKELYLLYLYLGNMDRKRNEQARRKKKGIVRKRESYKY